MDKKHLFGIIPLCLIIGWFIGGYTLSLYLIINYQIIDCILNLEEQLNVEFNKFPMSKEEQRFMIQQRCIESLSNFYNFKNGR